MIDPLLREKEDFAGIVTIVASLVPAPALLLFVNKPSIFAMLDLWRLMFLSVGIGFGVLFSSMFFVGTLTIASGNRQQRVRQRDRLPEPPHEKLKDWPLLYKTAALANTILYALTAWAYWHPFRLGATLVLLVIAETALALLFMGLFAAWPLAWTNPPRGGRAPPKQAA
jgi:hypothetical protein